MNVVEAEALLHRLQLLQEGQREVPFRQVPDSVGQLDAAKVQQGRDVGEGVRQDGASRIRGRELEGRDESRNRDAEVVELPSGHAARQEVELWTPVQVNVLEALGHLANRWRQLNLKRRFEELSSKK